MCQCNPQMYIWEVTWFKMCIKAYDFLIISREKVLFVQGVQSKWKVILSLILITVCILCAISVVVWNRLKGHEKVSFSTTVTNRFMYSSSFKHLHVEMANVFPGNLLHCSTTAGCSKMIFNFELFLHNSQKYTSSFAGIQKILSPGDCSFILPCLTVTFNLKLKPFT